MDDLSFEEVKAKWDLIFKDPLLSLTSLREKGVKGNICSEGLRSVCWKLYLAYLPSLDTATWSLTLHKERQHYADLRQKYITNPASESEHDSNDLSVNNPLSLDQANPWQEYFKDTELRKTIRQDVERTFPDKEYFRNPSSQSRLLDILFIYCKMNQDVSYRQGMHELLAPILWVVDNESIPGSNGYAVENGEDAIIRQTLNANYVEHDTFALFSALMKAAKVYYEYNDEVFNRRPVRRPHGSDLEFARIIKDSQAEAAKLTPVVNKCNKVYEYLEKVDPRLYSHLKDLDIEPQLYGIRWIRLLFGREFPLNKVLVLWDGIFAEDPTLRIVEFICVAMMLLIRDELLDSDYAECLSMLMRYPSTPGAEMLIIQAIYLRDRLTPEGGAYIIQQNALRAGKPIPATIPLPKESHKVENSVQEGIAHGAAAINKAFLNAVGEVKKNLRKNESHQSSVDYPQKYTQSVPNFSAYQQKSNLLRSESQNSLFDELTKLKEQNRQMAIVVQKGIEILEQEILGRTKSREFTNSADVEKIEKSSDGSESRSSFEYISSNNNEDSTNLSANEISVLHALHGLKHIRDVLNGSIKEFNLHIMEITSHTGEDHDHWEVVDDGVSVVSVTGTEDETASVTKETLTKQDKVITSSNSPINTPKIPAVETTSTKPPISTSPLQPSPISTKATPQPSQQRSNITNPTSVNTSLSRSSTNDKSKTTPKPPKTTPMPFQKSKLRLEDILNDMEDSETRIGTQKSSLTSNSKYSWMIDGYTDDDDNSLFNPKRSSIGSTNSFSSNTIDLSKDADNVFKTSSPRKTKNSTIVSSTPPLSSGRIDPLGASPFTSDNTNQEDIEKTENIESTSSEKPSNHIVTVTNVPVDDPLGVL